MISKQLSSSDYFFRYFSINLAITPEQKRKVYELRYRVYCQEMGYEDADQFPDEQECDEFDNRSLHCLITHNETGLAAGCVRMITGDESLYEEPLPLEKFCLQSLSIETAELLNRDRSKVCEISRLAVDAAFRRRRGESDTQIGSIGAFDFTDSNHHRARSLIAEAGFLAATAMAHMCGRHYMFAMMEPLLPRVMRKTGLHFERVGQEMDYHGLRAPYVVSVPSILKRIRPELVGLYNTMVNQFQVDYRGMLKIA